MCSAFSTIQNLNFHKMSPEQVNQVVEYGTRHLEFCAYLYRLQHEQGLYFLHEHPYHATSWNNPKIKDLLATEGIVKVLSHMCAFGMEVEDNLGKGLVKKPTGFMTNAPLLANRLSRQCKGDRRHIMILGGRSRRTEVYPDELCKEILVGLKDQMRKDGRLCAGGLGAVCPVDEPEGVVFNYEDVEFYDDISGQPLPTQGVLDARAEEIKQFYGHTVYSKVPLRNVMM